MRTTYANKITALQAKHTWREARELNHACDALSPPLSEASVRAQATKNTSNRVHAQNNRLCKKLT